MDAAIAFVERYLSDAARATDDRAGRLEELAEGRSARPLLQIDRHQHPELGELYQAQVGAPGRRAGKPGERADRALYLTRTDLGFAIVAVYSSCRACAGGIGAHGGFVSGGRCPECAGRRWIHEQGIVIGPLGAPLESRRLTAAPRPVHFYQSGIG